MSTRFNWLSLDNPFNSAPCTNCWESRLDRLIVWEPALLNSSSETPSSAAAGSKCLCKGSSSKPQQLQPVLQKTAGLAPIATVVSSTETLNLELIVDSAHSASSYFKHPGALFEAKYEFIHGPLCGPAVIAPSEEGELHFPHYEALSYAEAPRSVHCIWEVRVNRERDVWLHFDKVRFATRDCQDGRLDVFLPSRPDHPFLSICGHNVSSKDMPPLTSSDLTPVGGEPNAQPSVRIQFIRTITPARAAFKIAWTELFHLPRNPDGTLMTSRLTETESSVQTDCEFLCPGDTLLCIPARLVCNGVINCPAPPNLNPTLNSSIVDAGDEAPDLCAARTEAPEVNWLMVGLGATAGTILGVIFLFFICRCFCCCCCSKRHEDDDDDY